MWKYDNITPFGELLVKDNPDSTFNDKKIHTKSVVMQSYDDGWRIVG
jgi:hypothetical protein